MLKVTLVVLLCPSALKVLLCYFCADRKRLMLKSAACNISLAVFLVFAWNLADSLQWCIACLATAVVCLRISSGAYGKSKGHEPCFVLSSTDLLILQTALNHFICCYQTHNAFRLCKPLKCCTPGKHVDPSSSFKHSSNLHVPPALVLKSSEFCPRTLYMCFV